MLEPEIYQKPRLVTVFGGTGFIGRHVVENLTGRGYRVRIAVRCPEKAYYMLQIGDVGQTQMVRTDIGDKAAIARALAGADAAVYLPGAFYAQGKNNLRKLHVEGAENVAQAAAAAKIKLVHISALSAALGSKTTWLRSKAQGEERVQAACKKAVILRPAPVFGAEDRFFNRFANWARFTPFMPLFGGGAAKFQPVYVGDVAEMIARCVDGLVPQGKIYELGGREILTFRALMEEILRIIRRRRSFITVPVPLGLLWGSLCGLLGRLPLVPVIATAGQIRMLGYDSVVSSAARQERRTLEGAGISPRGLDVILPAYLWRFRVHGQFSRALS
ncbi:complex I NDUFA9 subunit family protein [Candidatus Tokpelaia sp.]|uniref:complex I NDUFA9 subunit family protein n=1 Tax=Candidatus Tokpelaia sp. TaxID=2233777 RepID=UPI001238CC75|nr:complex I NDUFA9 subunit family protein [Candidatus Tokpelaia sp.]KAA6405598.1 complex I NDUFA9 subunit family protein [Candidatus Tokpelaia sp.]